MLWFLKKIPPDKIFPRSYMDFEQKYQKDPSMSRVKAKRNNGTAIFAIGDVINIYIHETKCCELICCRSVSDQYRSMSRQFTAFGSWCTWSHRRGSLHSWTKKLGLEKFCNIFSQQTNLLFLAQRATPTHIKASKPRTACRKVPLYRVFFLKLGLSSRLPPPSFS